mgnify:CR=1 FL=1
MHTIPTIPDQYTPDRYGNERRRDELALRMIRHEARTCTIRACTGLSDDRIRRLYKAYAIQINDPTVRRRRGKSPRRITFFIRNTRAQFESSLLASAFTAFGLLQPSHDPHAHKSTGVPYEPLDPGPVGALFDIRNEDVDASYVRVDLDSRNVLIGGGREASPTDVQFHQQMVYAVAMKTLENFDRALGRVLHAERAVHDRRPVPRPVAGGGRVRVPTGGGRRKLRLQRRRAGDRG